MRYFVGEQSQRPVRNRRMSALLPAFSMGFGLNSNFHAITGGCPSAAAVPNSPMLSALYRETLHDCDAREERLSSFTTEFLRSDRPVEHILPRKSAHLGIRDNKFRGYQVTAYRTVATAVSPNFATLAGCCRRLG